MTRRYFLFYALDSVPQVCPVFHRPVVRILWDSVFVEPHCALPPNKPAGANSRYRCQFRFAVHAGWSAVAHRVPLGTYPLFVSEQFVEAIHSLVSRNVSPFVFAGIKTGDVRLQPVRVRQEPRHFRINAALHFQVADLAERQEIPPFIVRLVTIEVMGRQDAPRYRWTSATDTLVAGSLSRLAPFLSAVLVVLVSKSPHKICLLATIGRASRPPRRFSVGRGSLASRPAWRHASV